MTVPRTSRPSPQTTLIDYFEHWFLAARINISDGAATNYRVAIRHLDSFHRVPVTLGDLSDDLLLCFMRQLRSAGNQSLRTINNKRSAIKTVWGFAARQGSAASPGVRGRFREPKRLVQAWTVEEVARILDACDVSPSIQNWDRRHWRALVMVIYDTSHRIGVLLKTPRSAVDSRGRLLVRAEVSKHNHDTLHPLHPETLAAVAALPQHNLLFAWPLSKREIWRRFRDILSHAGLSTTRRDLFHKLRRTSFTYVYALLGRDAAREHAAHSSDVTASYLDQDLLRTLTSVLHAIDGRSCETSWSAIPPTSCCWCNARPRSRFAGSCSRRSTTLCRTFTARTKGRCTRAETAIKSRKSCRPQQSSQAISR